MTAALSCPVTRRAGVSIPLFSLATERSWGIGEIGDIVTCAKWLDGAELGVLQLLPINEMPLAETSPYSALSAMAVDPQFISMDQVEDFAEIGGETGLMRSERETLERVRMSPVVDYAAIRPLKEQVLRRCFDRFRAREWASGTRRASAFRAYADDQRWWLDDYALFRALHWSMTGAPWWEWPDPIRARHPQAIDAARLQLEREIAFRTYLQWLAADQWGTAREAVGPVVLFGDLPFMVASHSADVWARQEDFRMDASLGVPPDAFSDTGQDWRLPVYRWDVIASDDYAWLRHRARRNADLYDGYRVDHVVGFYRTYFRPLDGGAAGFTPDHEDEQTRLGERVLTLLRDAGAEIVAEDLGVVPDFVRASLARLGVPGFKVLRWERAWKTPGQPFVDPRTFPPASVATSGTHDTEPLATWWMQAQDDERAAVLNVPLLRERLSDDEIARIRTGRTLEHPLHEAMLEALYASGSNLVLLPIQDVFGWTDRINQPGTISPANWTWRLPWPVDRLWLEPVALERAQQLRAWAEAWGRSASRASGLPISR